MEISIDKIKKAYFVGIGGVSMSSLAIILKNNGTDVSGYDMYHSDNTSMLEALGIKIDYEHDLSKLDGVDTVIYTAAVTKETAPELSFAEEHNITLLTRAQLLGAVTASFKYSVGVSGTHGKSTTTGMIASIYDAFDKESSVIAGCVLPSIGKSYKIGKSDRVVFEACEYKDSFLSMRPSVKVILNCELDHVDYFDGIESIKASFRKYAETARSNQKGDNISIVNFDCANSVDAVKGCDSDVYYYSTQTETDFYAANITIDSGFGCFDLYRNGKCVINNISLSVPGMHNVSNAVAACAASLLTGIPADTVKNGIESFCGVARRFEKKGIYNGAVIFDDYAHHPDEIKVTLETARKLAKKRVICVFQPHTYSRTQALMDDFAKTLSLADMVFLAEIYPAREVNVNNISSSQLAALIPNCEFYNSFDVIADKLKAVIMPDDIVITMGAGEAYKVANILLSK